MKFIINAIFVLATLMVLNTSAYSADDSAMQASQHAELAVNAARNSEDIVLDYSPKSLELIDKLVLKFRQEGYRADEMRGILLNIGCYVGEVLIRNNEAKWAATSQEMQNSGVATMGVVSSSGVLWDPIGKIQKLMRNDAENSVVHFYKEFQKRP